MDLPSNLATVSGAQDLFNWFGYWPDFHDAEVLSLNLDRSALSTLRLHTWEMTGELDEKRHYVLKKHVIVEIGLREVFDLDLKEFSHQNVISGLTIERIEDGYRLKLGYCFGLHGTIDALELTFRITPGAPSDEQGKRPRRSGPIAPGGSI